MSRTIAETSESENQILSSTPSRPAFACAIISTEFGEWGGAGRGGGGGGGGGGVPFFAFGFFYSSPQLPFKAQKAHSAAIGLGFFAI